MTPAGLFINLNLIMKLTPEEKREKWKLKKRLEVASWSPEKREQIRAKDRLRPRRSRGPQGPRRPLSDAEKDLRNEKRRAKYAALTKEEKNALRIQQKPYFQKWYVNNRQTRNKREAERRKSHPEETLAATRKYHRKNRLKRNAACRERRMADPIHAADMDRRFAEWKKENPGKIIEYDVKARFKRMALIGKYTEDEETLSYLKESKNLTSYACSYCVGPRLGKPPIDHIIPLAGPHFGPHIKSNLCHACKRCNSQKKNRTPEELYAYRARKAYLVSAKAAIKSGRASRWPYRSPRVRRIAA